jgi:serine/threonine protein phosphatase PrpC
MKIYTALKKGEYHLTNCEDYIFTGFIGDDKILCAVMDGCTMGTDSYFASTLAGKLLRKIVKNIGYKELYDKRLLFPNNEDYIKYILRELLTELKQVKNQLMLERNELLTTLILLLVNQQENSGVALVIGDELVSVNGIVTEFDHDNKPDYIGYHFSDDFEDWYAKLNQKIQINNVEDVSISTDGIMTFTAFTATTNEDDIDPVDFLSHGSAENEDEDFLERKLKRLEHVYGLKPTDDVAIIRIIS